MQARLWMTSLPLAMRSVGFLRRVFVTEDQLLAADFRRILGARRIVFVGDRVVDYVVRWDARAAGSDLPQRVDGERGEHHRHEDSGGDRARAPKERILRVALLALRHWHPPAPMSRNKRLPFTEQRGIRRTR